MLNVGILYRAVEIIALLDEMNITRKRFLQNFPSYKYIQTDYIFDVSVTCDWIQNTTEDYLKPTERGYEILSCNDPVNTLRLQIKDVLNAKPPTWLMILKRGRKLVQRYMSKDEIQCFENANLLEESDRSVVSWWDELFLRSFEESDKGHYFTGRKGEYLTLIFEELRTNSKPKLISLDVNFAGYDILSQTSDSDYSPLYIEVKSSRMKWNQATFTISRNEWDVFTKNNNSKIYLWSFSPFLSFSHVTFEQLRQSIPEDHGIGKWKDVNIPFKLAQPIKNPFLAFPNIDRKTEEHIEDILYGESLNPQLQSR